MWVPFLVTIFTGYLLGNLNGAVMVSRLLDNEDVRQHGSGNAGLTNFVRTFGAAKAILVFVIDMAKTVLACMVGKLLFEPYGLSTEGLAMGAIAATLGHDFPALLGFHGGKGILCGLSIAICLDWRIAVMLTVIFAVSVLLSSMVSLGSVLGAVGFIIGVCVFYHDHVFVMILGILMGLLAIFMHRTNIMRIFKGTENKIGHKKK